MFYFICLYLHEQINIKMEISINIKSELVSKYDLSITELVVLEICNTNGIFDAKKVKDCLSEFNLKEDSVYRILKKLEFKGLISCSKSIGKNLYLIVDDSNTVMKIGVSNDTKKRLKNIQTSFHSKVNVIFDIKGKGYLEKELHTKFKKFRLSGEWFSYSQEILDYFKEINQ